MRFTLIKNLNQDKTMKPILIGLLFFTLFYIVTDIFIKYINFGLTKTTLSSTLYGNESEFIDPILFSTLLEFIHTEIFFIMMILLTLSAVFARVSKHYTLIVINLVMTSAIVSIISLVLAYFISDIFVVIYIGSFYIWHLIALYMSLYSIWKLNDKSI